MDKNRLVAIIGKMPEERGRNAELFEDLRFKRYAELGDSTVAGYEVLCQPDKIDKVRAAIRSAGLEIIGPKQFTNAVLRRGKNNSNSRQRRQRL